MTDAGFRDLVERICQKLKRTSETDPRRVAACKKGEDFEELVLWATRETLSDLGMTPRVSHTAGSHAFPDIVLEFSDGSRYGIEVKSSTSTGKGWRTNGNSVLGSTREEVLDTYIIFGKTAPGHQAFRYRRYAECVVDVAVTHSPRYRIDMELEPGETFFDKSGLSYEEISRAEKPIELITSYYKSQGQRAWWLAESTPAAIRVFSDLSARERAELIGYCFAHFPEVFSSSGSKFSRCAMWLAAEHSVVSSSLRDNFSAGGRVDIRFYDQSFERVPRIFDTLYGCKRQVIAALENATMEELCEDWGVDYRSEYEEHNKLSAWLGVAVAHCAREPRMSYDPKELLLCIMDRK